ncbi:cytochrome c oxidase subunit 3 [Micromonospora sp. HM5-17]|jgi:heme/copper-type cytochrome/quinol oxidase subunit 3|uniref:cytochrome c oxidase subunit 3 n=1 Tax=Micromonospora sp. HM5-17 TaxID=2487710 RepID=UPI000F475C72|nr:cytochrome c oxidase subunit 3 [Micromonospora sp. HM5-17]ROT28181.1 heme-copper oxidase subunit III [Micromonospora sp. HM5-17]
MTPADLRTALRPAGLVTEQPVGRSTAWWGVMLFIATEGTVFAALLGSYFYLRFQHGVPWPPDGIAQPDLRLPLVMTAVLVPSSLPVAWAEAGIRRGRRWQVRAGLLATLVMGGTFLGLQGMEYHENLREYTVTTNVYGSLFYVITTFHGAHVTVGLFMVCWLLAAAGRGGVSARRPEPVRVVAYYWHFVDAVWVAILFTVYLSPRL